ncbi:unnamed protein product [Protopolystoma xenopodis]|uniref:Amino acid permease/ SLC12A domain-containing protein n=1 Tax=Protopolystoma xenopodis TaxID=117903 RepID=A0A448XQJ9_9PLAT|nr:unnamed protein product [Protopolystoma xenopodis]
MSVGIVSCFGIQGSSLVNNIFTGINLLVIFVASIFMLVYARPEYLLLPVPANMSMISSALGSHALVPGARFLPFGVPGLLAGAATCFNAFIGFDMISTCAEEAADPARSMPRANAFAVAFVSLIISICSLALVLYVPWYTVDYGAPYLLALLNGVSVGGGSEEARTGMFFFIGAGCLLGLTASLLSSMIAAPRITYAMAQDGIVFRILSHVCQPFKVISGHKMSPCWGQV